MDRRLFLGGAAATGALTLGSPGVLSAQRRLDFTRSNLSTRQNRAVEEAVHGSYHVLFPNRRANELIVDIDVFLARSCPFSQRLFAYLQSYRGRANILLHLDPVNGEDVDSLLHLWLEPDDKTVWNFENVRRYMSGVNFKSGPQSERESDQAIVNFNGHLAHARRLNAIKRGTPKVVVTHGPGSFFIAAGFNETTRAIFDHYA